MLWNYNWFLSILPGLIYVALIGELILQLSCSANVAQVSRMRDSYGNDQPTWIQSLDDSTV